MDLHAVLLQVAVLKATSLCLRARSWTQMPSTEPAASLDDAHGGMLALGARDEP